MDRKQAKKRDRRGSTGHENEEEGDARRSKHAKRQRTSQEEEDVESRPKRRVVADSSDDEEDEDNDMLHDDVEDDDDVDDADGEEEEDEETKATTTTTTSKQADPNTKHQTRMRSASMDASAATKKEEEEEDEEQEETKAHQKKKQDVRSTPSRALKQEKDYLDDAPPHSSMKRVHDENRQIIRDTLRDYNINDFHVAALVPHAVCNPLMYNALCESYYVVCVEHDDDSQPCVLIMGETGYMNITLRSTATLLVKDRATFRTHMDFMFARARREAETATPAPSQDERSSSSPTSHGYDGEEDEEVDDAFSDEDDEECMLLATDKYKNESPICYQFSHDMTCVKKISGETMKVLMNAVYKWNAKTESEQSPIVMVWTSSGLLLLRALSDERINNSITCNELLDHEQAKDIIPAPHTDYLFFPSSVVTGALSMNLHNVFVTMQSVRGVKAETPSSEEQFTIVDLVAGNDDKDSMKTQTSMVFLGSQTHEITKKPRIVSVDEKVDVQFNLSGVRKLFPTGSKISFSQEDAIVQVSTWTNNKYWKVDMFIQIVAELSNDNEYA